MMAPVESEPLALLTPSEVLLRVRKKQSAARADGKQMAWDKLELLVGADCQSRESQDELEDIWRIRRIEITGFRGASPDPKSSLVVDLPTCPGLTVFHGQNGSGKSTIAHALRVALHPGYNSKPRSTRAKVSDNPWEPCDVHVDVDLAKIEVMLHSDSGEQIQATVEIAASGGETTRLITRGDQNIGPEWEDAYRIHRPVFAYADEHGAIKGADDLRSFLFGHLLIGGYLDSLREKIKPGWARANEAFQAVENGWQTFEGTLKEISERYPEASTDIQPVERPDDEQTRESWLTEYSFTGDLATRTAPRLSVENVSATHAAIDAAHSAVAAYRQAASAAWGPLDHALNVLLAEAKICPGLPDDECPVCGSDAQWRTALTSRMRDLQHLNEPRNNAAGALAELRPHVEVLESMATLLDLDDAERPVPELVPPLRNALLERRLLANGEGHNPAVLSALEALHRSFADSRFGQLANRLVEQSHVLQQWNHERSKAARKFADVWWENRKVAKNRDLWRSVNDCVIDLEQGIRTERERQLMGIVKQTCAELLDSPDLILDALGIQQKTAMPTFNAAGNGGSLRPLGALSAGQQNAFLLAPVVGPRSPRPFGFVVFDDPVHALDDFRIETLATFLRERAKEHQVLVFTHDERLAETLRMSTPESKFLTIERNPTSSEIVITPDEPLWQRLLEVCSASLNAGEHEPQVKPGVARALMRQALDAAIRDALISHVLDSSGRNLQEALDALSSRNRTADRLKHLIDDYSNTDLALRAEEANKCLSHDLPLWDLASHRDEMIDKVGVLKERKRAWWACRRLTDKSLEPRSDG